MGLNRAAQGKGSGAVFGDPWVHMIVCTNWSKANLFEADFSGALVNGNQHFGGQKASRPSFIQAHAFASGFSMINGLKVPGKDAGGNNWLYGVLRKKVWPVIEKALQMLPKAM